MAEYKGKRAREGRAIGRETVQETTHSEGLGMSADKPTNNRVTLQKETTHVHAQEGPYLEERAGHIWLGNTAKPAAGLISFGPASGPAGAVYRQWEHLKHHCPAAKPGDAALYLSGVVSGFNLRIEDSFNEFLQQRRKPSNGDGPDEC